MVVRPCAAGRMGPDLCRGGGAMGAADSLRLGQLMTMRAGRAARVRVPSDHPVLAVAERGSDRFAKDAFGRKTNDVAPGRVRERLPARRATVRQIVCHDRAGGDLVASLGFADRRDGRLELAIGHTPQRFDQGASRKRASDKPENSGDDDGDRHRERSIPSLLHRHETLPNDLVVPCESSIHRAIEFEIFIWPIFNGRDFPGFQ